MPRQSSVLDIAEVGRKLPRVTSITNELNKPALVYWSANITAEYMLEVYLEQLQSGFLKVEQLQKLNPKDIYLDAKRHHYEVGKKEADRGTKTHEAIEKFIKAKDKDKLTIPKDIEKPFAAFLKWWEICDVKPIFSERRVWTLDAGGFTGQIDLGALMHEEEIFYIWDFKTAKGIYDEYKYQLAAYTFAMIDTLKREKVDLDLKKAGLLRLDKETGWPDPHEYEMDELAHFYDCFKSLCEFWHKKRKGKYLG